MIQEKLSVRDFPKAGRVVKQSDVYSVFDSPMEKLVVSMTVLHPGKETGGHGHEGSEEVYFFVSGSGEMQLGQDRFHVREGDIVKIPGGKFHKVFNTAGRADLTFICVFEKYGDRM
jgi:mannose-6-phosphate isomerase-like protein (cupin superfamily)